MLQSSGFPVLSDSRPRPARSRIRRLLVQRPLTPTQELSQFAAFFIGVWNRAIHLLASYLNPFSALLNPFSMPLPVSSIIKILKDSCYRPVVILASKGVRSSFIAFRFDPYTTMHLCDAHPIFLLSWYRHLPLDFS